MTVALLGCQYLPPQIFAGKASKTEEPPTPAPTATFTPTSTPSPSPTPTETSTPSPSPSPTSSRTSTPEGLEQTPVISPTVSVKNIEVSSENVLTELNIPPVNSEVITQTLETSYSPLGINIEDVVVKDEEGRVLPYYKLPDPTIGEQGELYVKILENSFGVVVVDKEGKGYILPLPQEVVFEDGSSNIPVQQELVYREGEGWRVVFKSNEEEVGEFVLSEFVANGGQIIIPKIIPGKGYTVYYKLNPEGIGGALQFVLEEEVDGQEGFLWTVEENKEGDRYFSLILPGGEIVYSSLPDWIGGGVMNVEMQGEGYKITVDNGVVGVVERIEEQGGREYYRVQWKQPQAEETSQPQETPTPESEQTPSATATSTPTNTPTSTLTPEATPTLTPEKPQPTPTPTEVARRLSIAEKMLKESVQKTTVGGVDFYLHPSLVNLPIERGVPIKGIYKDEQFEQKYGISADDLVREAVLYGMYRGWQNAEDGKYLNERGKVDFEEYKRRLEQGEDLSFPFWVFTDPRSVREPNKQEMIDPNTKIIIIMADVTPRWGLVNYKWYNEKGELIFVVSGVPNDRSPDGKEATKGAVQLEAWIDFLFTIGNFGYSSEAQKSGGEHISSDDTKLTLELVEKFIVKTPWSSKDSPIKTHFEQSDFEEWWKKK